MVLASCRFWMDSGVHLFWQLSVLACAEEKKKEGAGSWSSLLACRGVTAIDRLECRQSWIPLPTLVEGGQEDSKDTGCPVHSRAMTPWGVSATGSISPCTICRGSVLIFTRLSLMLVTTPHFWSLFYFAFSLHLLVCSSAPPCPNALQKPLPRSALVPLSLPQHIHPRALLAFAPALDKSYWAHPELLPHPHGSKLS